MPSGLLPRRWLRTFCACRSRLCMLISLIVCCLFLFSLPVNSSKSVGHQQAPLDHAKLPSPAIESALGVKQKANYQRSTDHDSRRTPSADTPRSSGVAQPKHDENSARFAGKDVSDAQAVSTDGMMKAIQRLEELMPDELQIKQLLAPFDESGGEPHLRDLALRTRAFKDAFEAWGSLHLQTIGNVSVVDSEIIHKLRAINLPLGQLHDAIRTYDSFRAYINLFTAHLYPYLAKWSPDFLELRSSFYRGGRGLVFTAGDQQLPYLLTSIPSFRKLGSKLPIEILYLGDADLSLQSRIKLEAIDNVFTRDLSNMIDDTNWELRGWAAKPFALLMSSFREACFIDADALFFVNPDTLFDDEQYTQAGALFFKDRNTMPGSKRSWLTEILPPPLSQALTQNRLWTGESTHMQDSGVVIVDKWRHFLPLLLLTRLNGPDRDGDDATGKKGTYDMVFGDKETFWLSWELSGSSDYAFYDGEAGTMGVLSTQRPSKQHVSGSDQIPQSPTTPKKFTGYPSICSQQLAHFDRSGRPMWFNGWLATRKLDDETEVEFRDIKVYARETKERRRRGAPDPYTVQEANVVCMQTDDAIAFSSEEQAILDMMRDLASEAIAEW